MVVSTYALGTLALFLAVGNYYRIHDRYMHDKSQYEKAVLDRKHSDRKAKEFTEKIKKNMKIVCYFMLERKFHPDNLTQLNYCTHLIVGPAVLQESVVTAGHPGDWSLYKKISGFKKAHPKLKIMLSVAGDSYGIFSRMASAWISRFTFISSVLSFLDEYEFDGLDIDWEFPVIKGGVAADRNNFVLLLKELKETFKIKEKNYILSAAVAALSPLIHICYHIPGLAKYLDFINLMSYDYYFYGPEWEYTAHHAPLFPTGYGNPALNVMWSVEHWAFKGFPKHKIMLGISTHARTYKLANETKNKIGVKAIGPGLGNGIITFPRVCEFLRKGAVPLLDGHGEMPFAYHNRDWVSYDDPYSITIKAVWAREAGCGGVMTFSLNTDDWAGKCDNATKFPLHRAVWKALRKGY